jgi:chemotaxis protein methyltransferase CheR
MRGPGTERIEAAEPATSTLLSDTDFALFQGLVYREAGIHLASHKKALLVARLGRRLRELGLGSHRAYLRRVGEDAAERVAMLDLLTTNETRFFREPHHFEFLERSLIPAWKAAAARGDRPRDVRIWSAGCSTGEEPYSLAMCLLHHFPPLSGWSLHVHASDLSTRALDRAFTGIYPEDRVSGVPEAYLRRFMLRGTGPCAGRVRVAPGVRALVSFERLNLNDPFVAPGPFDAILCRNVLIYFDADSRRRAVERMAEHLAPGGHFFLGHSESLNGVTDALRHVAPNIYVRPAERAAGRCA